MQNYTRKFADIVRRYFRAIVASMLLIALGCVIGNIVARFLSQDRLSVIYENVSGFYKTGQNIGIDKWTLFFESLKEYTFSFVFILVCSFSVWFVPITFIRLIYEGFCMGLSSGILVALFGKTAFFHTAIWLLLKNTFYIPLLVAFGVYSVNKAVRRSRGGEIKRKDSFKTVVCGMLCVLALSVICSFAESHIMAVIILRLI